MEAAKILYVFNPKSGSSDSNDFDTIVSRVMTETGNFHEIFLLTGEGDKPAIKQYIDDYNPDVIVAAGGDGTINLVASVIVGIPLKLGIIPLGSANGLAYELGIPGNIEDATRLVVEGQALPMDVVRINDEHISLHLSDVGINARIIKKFEQEGKRGLMSYFKQFIKILSKPQKKFKCTINTDHVVFKYRSYMTLVANANRYRTGANVNPNGKIDDGKFEIIVIRPHRRWILHGFIGAFTGTFHKKPNVEIHTCTTAIIKVTPPQELQIDGELMGPTSEIRAVSEKHALNVIRQAVKQE